jgi:SAM-dependent methyltransferase
VSPVPATLPFGNTAKLYCLQLLDEAAAPAEGEFRIVDLGCGDGRNFVDLLARHAHVRYVGVEPSRASAQQARRNLPSAKIVNARAHELPPEPADAVVSFSALEHVVDRNRYMKAVAANLAPGGRVYLNYDSGHFTGAGFEERARSLAGRVLTLFGNEEHYRARVNGAEFDRLIADAGLTVVDDKLFNTDVKRLCASVEADRRDAFMERWLAFELELNGLGLSYSDELESIFRTRNVILRTAPSNPGPDGSPDPIASEGIADGDA